MSRNPYHLGRTKRELRPSVLAFVDVLGYSQMIAAAKKSTQQEQLFNNLYSALAEGRKGLEGKYRGASRLPKLVPKDFFVLKAFTDNIVIAWPIRDDAEVELGQAISKLAFFQFSMTLAGFFVRGAISIGDAFVDDIAVFGDALTKAYIGESSQRAIRG